MTEIHKQIEDHPIEQSKLQRIRDELFAEFRDDAVDSLDASLDILPSEEEFIDQIRTARRDGDLKQGVVRAELLALRLEIMYVRDLISTASIEPEKLEQILTKMRMNIGEELHENSFSVIRWSLDGLQARLKQALDRPR